MREVGVEQRTLSGEGVWWEPCEQGIDLTGPLAELGRWLAST